MSEAARMEHAGFCRSLPAEARGAHDPRHADVCAVSGCCPERMTAAAMPASWPLLCCPFGDSPTWGCAAAHPTAVQTWLATPLRPLLPLSASAPSSLCKCLAPPLACLLPPAAPQRTPARAHTRLQGTGHTQGLLAVHHGRAGSGQPADVRWRLHGHRGFGHLPNRRTVR